MWKTIWLTLSAMHTIIFHKMTQLKDFNTYSSILNCRWRESWCFWQYDKHERRIRWRFRWKIQHEFVCYEKTDICKNSHSVRLVCNIALCRIDEIEVKDRSWYGFTTLSNVSVLFCFLPWCIGIYLLIDPNLVLNTPLRKIFRYF